MTSLSFYFYLIIYHLKLLQSAFTCPYLSCSLRSEMSLLVTRLGIQKVLIKSSMTSWTFRLKFLFIFIAPPSTSVSYYLISFPNVFFFFPLKDTPRLGGVGCTNKDTYWISPLIFLIAHFSFKKVENSLVFKFPDIHIQYLSFSLSPHPTRG